MRDTVPGDKEARQLIVRPAMPEDGRELLKWRNDPYVRAMSRHSDVIDAAHHAQWYERALASPDKILLVGLVAGQRIGMVRFDRCRLSMWEISIMVAPESRGLGISRPLLQNAMACFHQLHGGSSLLAVIKKCNMPSLRIFESLGFKNTIEEDVFTTYIFQPALSE